MIDENKWNHLSENGMATNRHRTMGGIIDRVAASTQLRVKEEWFIVFNHPELDVIDGLASKAEAFEVFAKTFADKGINE